MRNPANDLTSFDISKRSPEQIAELFARWKEQRKRVETPVAVKPDGRAGLRPARTEVSASHEGKVPPTTSIREPKKAGAIAYTTDFAAVLAAGEALPAPEAKAPWRPPLAPAPLPEVKRGRSSRAQWALAGIASAVVATAVYGAVQWQKQELASIDGNANGAIAATSDAPADAEARPQRPTVQESAPLLPAAIRTLAAEATVVQQIIDAALLRAPPADDAAGVGTEVAQPALTPILKPPVDTAVDPVQTASTPAMGPSIEAPVERATLARPTPILSVPFGATASDQSRATTELAPIGPPLPISRATTSAGRVTIDLDPVIGAGGTEEGEVESAYDGWPSRLDERGGDRPVRSGSLDGGVARAGDEGTSGGTGGDTGSSSGGTGTGGTGTGSGSDPGDGTGGSGTGSGDGSSGGTGSGANNGSGSDGGSSDGSGSDGSGSDGSGSDGSGSDGSGSDGSGSDGSGSDGSGSDGSGSDGSGSDGSGSDGSGSDGSGSDGSGSDGSGSDGSTGGGNSSGGGDGSGNGSEGGGNGSEGG